MGIAITELEQIDPSNPSMLGTDRRESQAMLDSTEHAMPYTTDTVLTETLGLLPKGSYLMTAAFEGQRGGMVVSSVQRCCDDPALLCVAARKGHAIDPLIRDSRGFAVGIIPEGDKMIPRKFRFDHTAVSPVIEPIADDPFEAIPTTTMITGSPLLTRCPVWFDCEVTRRIDLEANYELFVGRVMAILHNGERIDLDHEPSDDDD